MTIDLNCDLGEIPEAVVDGTQERILRHITSANVACGAHAGDERMMEQTIRQAVAAGVAVGAHPGYPDRQHFGRVPLPLGEAEIEESVYAQVCALAAVAARLNAALRHVKPHGALYNVAARDAAVARAIARGVARWNGGVVLVGLAGSSMLDAWRGMGFRVAAEAFADRAYEPDGTLRARSLPGAVLDDPDIVAAQALSLATSGRVRATDGTALRIEPQTLCIHGDTPGAARIAAEVAERLRAAGVQLRAC